MATARGIDGLGAGGADGDATAMARGAGAVDRVMGVGDASGERRFFAVGVSSGSGVAFFFALDFAPLFDVGSFFAAVFFFFVFGFALGDSFGVAELFSTPGVSLDFGLGEALFLFGEGDSSSSVRGVGDFFGFGDNFSFSLSDVFGFGVGVGVFFFFGFGFGDGDSSGVADALVRAFKNSARFSSSLTCA